MKIISNGIPEERPPGKRGGRKYLFAAVPAFLAIAVLAVALPAAARTPPIESVPEPAIAAPVAPVLPDAVTDAGDSGPGEQPAEPAAVRAAVSAASSQPVIVIPVTDASEADGTEDAAADEPWAVPDGDAAEELAQDAAAEPVAVIVEPEPEPEPVAVEPDPEPEPEPDPEPEPEPAAEPAEDEGMPDWLLPAAPEPEPAPEWLLDMLDRAMWRYPYDGGPLCQKSWAQIPVPLDNAGTRAYVELDTTVAWLSQGDLLGFAGNSIRYCDADWFTITGTDGWGIQFPGCNTDFAVYGPLDEYGEVTAVVRFIYLGEDGYYAVEP